MLRCKRRVAGVPHDVEPLGEGLHHAVLDPVVNHLDEVPGAHRAAVQVSQVRRADLAVTTARRSNSRLARRQRPEDRLDVRDGLRRAANHQTVPTIGAPDTAAGTGIHIADAVCGERRAPTHVVFEPRVAAVDDDVAGRQQCAKRRDRALRGLARRHHHPHHARLGEACDQGLERAGASGAVAGHGGNRVGAQVRHDARVAGFHQAARHVGAHFSETDQSNLHG